MASEPDETDRTSIGPSSSCTDAAFLELAHNLELYIEDILWQPTFHGFLDLPIELRYKIYEEYFSNNEGVITTQLWPQFSWHRSEYQRRASTPFLPRLCLASKVLLKEAATFLLASVEFSFEHVGDLMCFLEAAAQFQTLRFNIAHHVRRLYVQDVNELSSGRSGFVNGRRFLHIDMVRTELANASTSVALNNFQGLRELVLAFHALARLRSDTRTHPSRTEWTALPIGSYLRGFSLRSILRLKTLRKVMIVGVSGLENVFRDVDVSYDLTAVICENDTVENLRPLSKLASQIKTGFKANGQDVEVKTYLYWGKREEEEMEIVE